MRQRPERLTNGVIVLCACLAIFLTGAAGCASYKKVYQVEGLTIIYADGKTISTEYRSRGGRLAAVSGFYDPERKEIWCAEGDDATCGHELRHVTQGLFH